MLKRPRTPPIICTFDLRDFSVVMVTVVFVMLILVMLISGGPHHSSVSVNMPRAYHAAVMRRASREDAMVIGVTRDGKVYFGHDPVTPDQIPSIIRERLSEGTEQKVYLRVDRNAMYAFVAKALAEIRSVDVERVDFLVEKAYVPQGSSE